MPDTQTANYNWTKPEIGGSDDTWGIKLNATLDAIDAKMKEAFDKITTTVQNQLYPVGTVITTAKEGNPNTWLNFGTWEAEAPGRAIVGVGNADGIVWTNGMAAGASTVVLTEAQLPPHAHVADPPATATVTDVQGTHAHGISPQLLSDEGSATHGVSNDEGGTVVNATQAAGAHAHNVTVDIPAFWTQGTGSGSGHPNLQPSIARYHWRRTA